MTDSDPMLECPCEDEHPKSTFKYIEGWWCAPYPDIDWFGPWGDAPAHIFTESEPENSGAWYAPCGSIMRDLRVQSDPEEAP